MDIRWERSLHQASLVLADENENTAEGFETKMVCIGGVPGLLPMTIRQMDGKAEYVYDVTARRPLSEHLKGKSLTLGTLVQILDSVLSVVEGMGAFLLDPAHLLYFSERIFVQGDFGNLHFCYVPFLQKPLREGLYALVMELLDKTDAGDRNAIVLCYRLAHALQGENVSLQELRELLHGENQEMEKLSDQNPVIAEQLAHTNTGGLPGFGLFPEESQKMANGFPPANSRELSQSDLVSGSGAIRGFREEEWTREAEEKRGDTLLARLGLNRRAVWIVLLGAALLLLAYLSLHTELLKGGLLALLANTSLVAIVSGLAAAALAVLFLRKRLARRRKTRAPSDRFDDLERADAARLTALSETGKNAVPPGFSSDGNPAVPSGFSTGGNPAVPSGFSTGGNPAVPSGFSAGGNPAFPSGYPEGADHTVPSRFPTYPEDAPNDLVTSILAPPKTSFTARLVPENPKKKGGEIPLARDFTLLGKQSDLVDAVIPSPVVSRVHASICRKEGQWYVTDLNSRNGTRLRGEMLLPMQDTPLENGDSVSFADIPYLFETAPQADSARF